MGDTLRIREHISKPPGSVFVGSSFREWPSGAITETINHSRSGIAMGFPFSERSWDFTNPGPPYRDGAAFICVKGIHDGNSVSGSCHVRVPWFAGTTQNYVGGFLPADFGPAAISVANLQNVGSSGPYSGDYGSPEPYSATAYNRAKPKIEELALLQALAEQREAPETLRGTVQTARELYLEAGGNPSTPFMAPRTVSKHFLNTTFGWGPTVADVVKTVAAYQASDKILARIERNNGRYGKVGRRIVDKEDYTLTATTYSPQVFPVLSGTFLQPRSFEGRTCTGYTRYYTVVRDEVWFEGSFMYYIPSFDRSNPSSVGMIGRLQRLYHAYGMRLSPVTVYNLTPWSWLADYFTNLGDVVEGASSAAFDPIVNKYAFSMRHLTEKRVANATIFFRDGQTYSAAWEQTIDSKRRLKATPFGFNVNMDSLSPYQLAVLAALGISR